MGGSTVRPVKMRRCKRCKVHTIDTEYVCPSCGEPTVMWYVDAAGKILVVILAIAVLVFIVFRSEAPSLESLPPSH